MNMSIEIRAADPVADASALADIALDAPMDGVLRVAMVPGRRPDVWEKVAGPRTTLLALENCRAIGSLALSPRWLNLPGGVSPVRCGYLGELRVRRESRRKGVATSLGMAAAQLEKEAGSAYTIMVTLAGNATAEALLKRDSPLPAIRPLAHMRMSQLITLGSGRMEWNASQVPAPEGELATPGTRAGAVAVRAAAPGEMHEIWRLLRDFWSVRSFAPVWTFEEFQTHWKECSQAGMEDLLVLVRGDTILACGALWDQRSLRRVVVLGYRPALAVVARALRIGAKMRGAPSFPPVGEELPIAAVRFLAADDAADARRVLRALVQRARARGILIVSLGLDRRDPIASCVRGQLRVDIASTLWAGQAHRDTPDLAGLMGRPAFVDYSLV